MLPFEVIPIERIEGEARAAAREYSDVNDACPYPFCTDAGRVFARAFRAARVEMEADRQPSSESPA